MNSSRGIRFGAFAASVLAFWLVAGVAGAAATTVYATDATAWHPESVSIAAGGTVTWENRDTKYPHTVYCDQGSSNAPCPWTDAPNMAQRASSFSQPSTVSITFPKDGTFAYYCSIHPIMTGTIVVGSGHPPASTKPSSTPRTSQSARPTIRATTSAPSASASANTSAKATPKTTVKGKTVTKPTPSLSGKALGETSSKGNGPRAGVLVPAALLITLVGGGHFARARRRSA
jgi:plastocyanin